MKDITTTDLISFTKYKVTSADSDMYARNRIGSLVNFLIQSAINSADNLGFGLAGLRQQQLFWVLSRMTVEVCRPLKWYDEVEVETWPKNIDRLLYLRDFLVRDKDQNIVAKATSGWLAIDLETKRPKKFDDIHKEIFVHLKNKHAIEELPEKLAQIAAGDLFEYKPGYFDIDLNKHVTSTRYIDWMMDTFPLDFHLTNYPVKLSVNYLKETMPGEKIQLYRNQLNVNQFHFEGINSINNTNAFRGLIKF